MKRFCLALSLSLASGLGSLGCGSKQPALFSELPTPTPVQAGDPAPAPAAAEPAAEPSANPMPAPPEVGPAPVAPPMMLPSDEPSGVDTPAPAVPALPTEGVTRPVILTVSPADGASGVEDDAVIVVRFSVAMNRERTEAAYASESMPSSSVTFSWNDAGTELTVTPIEPLEYAAGTDPAEVEARRYDFFISATAEDVEGSQLGAPQPFSFSVLRQIDQTLFPVQQRDQTGNWRSNDTYGNVTCQRTQTTICVGDSFVDGGEEQYRGFLTFDMGSLPSELASVASAELEIELTDITEEPFAGLGALILDHVGFDVIGLDAFNADPISELGPIADAGELGGVIRADVSSAIAADLLTRSVTQYRFRFEGDTDNDDTSDIIVLDWGAQRLVVSYLIP